MQKAFTFYLKVCRQTDECMDGYQSLSLRLIKNKRTKNKIHIDKENTLIEENSTKPESWTSELKKNPEDSGEKRGTMVIISNVMETKGKS